MNRYLNYCNFKGTVYIQLKSVINYEKIFYLQKDEVHYANSTIENLNNSCKCKLPSIESQYQYLHLFIF